MLPLAPGRRQVAAHVTIIVGCLLLELLRGHRVGAELDFVAAWEGYFEYEPTVFVVAPLLAP